MEFGLSSPIVMEILSHKAGLYSELIFIAFAYALMFIFIYVYSKKFEPSERSFVWWLSFSAFTLHVIFILYYSIAMPIRNNLGGGDAFGYILQSYYMVQKWQGNMISTPKIAETNMLYYYWVASIYYTFGLVIYAPAYTNALIATITTIILARYYKDFIAWRAVQYFMFIFSFYPSLFLFNSVIRKDTILIFLTAIIFVNINPLLKRFSISSLIKAVASSVLLYMLRFYQLYILLISVAAGTFLLFREQNRLNKGINIAAGVIALIAFIYTIQHSKFQLDVETFSLWRHYLASGGSSVERIEYHSWLDIILYLPKGLLYFFLAPFYPHNFASLLSFLEKPLWLGIIYFGYKGIRFLLKYYPQETWIFTTFILALTLLYSMIEGNIGTMYRKKIQIYPYLFMFASVGILEHIATIRKIPELYILAPQRRMQWATEEDFR